MTYCAPAARPFRHLHIAEPGADFHAPDGAEALTVCGLIMARADLWVPINRQPADRVCLACLGEAEPPARQLTLMPSALHHASADQG